MTKKVKKNNIDVTEEEVEKFLDEWDNAPDIIEMENYKSEDDCTNEIEQKKVENAVVTNNGLGFDKPEQVFIRDTDLSDCCSSLIIEGTNICVMCKKPCNPVRDRVAEFMPDRLWLLIGIPASIFAISAASENAILLLNPYFLAMALGAPVAIFLIFFKDW